MPVVYYYQCGNQLQEAKADMEAEMEASAKAGESTSGTGTGADGEEKEKEGDGGSCGTAQPCTLCLDCYDIECYQLLNQKLTVQQECGDGGLTTAPTPVRYEEGACTCVLA